MGAIQQIYESKQYSSRPRRTLRQTLEEIYVDNDDVDQQKFPYQHQLQHSNSHNLLYQYFFLHIQ